MKSAHLKSLRTIRRHLSSERKSLIDSCSICASGKRRDVDDPDEDRERLAKFDRMIDGLDEVMG
jgi:hypothetical protein